MIQSSNLEDFISTVSDFPKQGVSFRDFSPLLLDVKAREVALKELTSILYKYVENTPTTQTVLAAIESRGFILGSLLAERLKLPLLLIRKPNKLPGEVYSEEYGSEYSTDKLEIQNQSFKYSTKSILIDDVLATGGTALAASKLLSKISAPPIAVVTLIELDSLKGRDALQSQGYTNVESLIHY